MSNTPSQIGAEIADGIDEALQLERTIRRFATGGGLIPSTSPEFAAEIMRRNYLGPADAEKFFGVNPLLQDPAALHEVPWNKETLEALSETHILVAMPSLSILDMRRIVVRRYTGLLARFRGREKVLFYDQDAYDTMAFARDKGEVRWQLIRKESVDRTFSKPWNEQVWYLNATEVPPYAQTVVYAMIGHYLKTGERLFEKTRVRTADTCPDKRRVHVGDFDVMGLDIGFFTDERRDATLGIGSEQRPWTSPLPKKEPIIPST